MSYAAAIAVAQAATQAALEDAHAGTIVIKLGTNTSSSLAAAVVIKPMTKVFDGTGQESRVQPCSAHVKKSLLPDWATQETMASKAKITTSGKTYKVHSMADVGDVLQITAFRWPNDDD